MESINWSRVAVLGIGAAVVVVGALVRVDAAVKADLIALGTLIIGYAVPSGWLDRKKIQQNSQDGNAGK